MAKRILFLVLICNLLAACDDYDWDTKLIIEGRVVDHNGTAVPGITVSTQVDTDPTIGNSSNDEIISYTTTDANGFYRMMFPRPNFGGNINLLINEDQYGNSLNSIYSNTEIYNIAQEDFNDYLVNLGDNVVFPLGAVTTLTVDSFNDPSLTGSLVSYTIQGLLPQNRIDYNFNDEIFLEQFLPTTYDVAVNQDVVIRYTLLVDGMAGQEYITTEVSVPIGNSPANYTINY